MITSRGANDHLSIRDVNNHINEILESEIVYFSGYSLSSKTTSESIHYYK